MFEIGLVWVLSSINVMVRDLQNVIALIIIMLMMLSPIADPGEAIPAMYSGFLKLNPLYYYIVANQKLLMYQTMPAKEIWIPMILMGLGFFVIGYQLFIRMKRVFVDNV